jgi:hypothetical protein
MGRSGVDPGPRNGQSLMHLELYPRTLTITDRGQSDVETNGFACCVPEFYEHAPASWRIVGAPRNAHKRLVPLCTRTGNQSVLHGND